MDGSNNNASGGFIVLQVTTESLIQAGGTAIANVRQDIEHSGIVDMVATGGFVNNDNFLNSLGVVVTKLGIFVRIVDKAAKVHNIGVLPQTLLKHTF